MKPATHEIPDRSEKTRKTILAVWLGVLNPLFLCLFIPIIEGKPCVNFEGTTGFWGQFALAVVIAVALGLLPLFHQVVEKCIESFRLGGDNAHTTAAVVARNLFGATFLFSIIALGEIVLTSGVGAVGETDFFSRWAKLVVTGWPFVAICGLILTPVAEGLTQLCMRALNALGV